MQTIASYALSLYLSLYILILYKLQYMLLASHFPFQYDDVWVLN